MSEYRGSQIRTNATARTSGPLSREGIGDLFGGGTNIRLWDAAGYPEETDLTFDYYWHRYQRTGAAHGIVEKFPSDTWQDFPEIRDDTDAEGDTDFDEAVEDLFERDEAYRSRKALRKTPAHWLVTADKLATLGQFSVIVLGFADGGETSEPIPGFEEGAPDTDDNEDDTESKPFDGPSDLEFIAVYSQNEVQDYEIEDDFTSENFRLPTSYEIEYTEDGDVAEFHHSRVIHVPEGVLTNPLEGTPRTKPITHELVNIDKILAASAEGYWRGAYQGIVIKPPTNSDGVPLQFLDGGDGSNPQDSSELANQINQWTNNFRRTITSTGDIEQLDASIASPTDHLEAQYRSIATALDAPMSILMGNETGERATSEDRDMWHELIGGRRNNFAEPVILRPFLDRLIAVGVLPEPDGEAYEIEWPALDEMSESETAEVHNVLSQAIDRLSGGNPADLFTRAERRKILDYEPEYGQEVDDDEVEQPEVQNPEDALPPEDVAEQVQEGVEEYDQPLGPQSPEPEQ